MTSPFKCHATPLKNRFHVFVVTPKLTGPHKSNCSHSRKKKSNHFQSLTTEIRQSSLFFFYKVITLKSNVILVRAGLFVWSPFVIDSPLRIGWVSRPSGQKECPWSFSCWSESPTLSQGCRNLCWRLCVRIHLLALAWHIPHHMFDCHASDQ